MLVLEGLAVERDERSPEVKFKKLYLRPGQYAFGRTPDSQQVVLQEDASISRNHAELSVLSYNDQQRRAGIVALLKGAYHRQCLHANSWSHRWSYFYKKLCRATETT